MLLCFCFLFLERLSSELNALVDGLGGLLDRLVKQLAS